jgi:DNA transformation protein
MQEFTHHCIELLAPLGAVRSRRMFGGVGLYVDEIFVALIDDEQLYLKGDELTRPRFEAAGAGQPFCFPNKDGEMVATSYLRPPEEAMESPALMLPWARLALEAALRKPKPRTKRKKTSG